MKVYFLSISLFFLLSTIFLAHYFFVGQAVYGDGIYYWSYTRSIWKDHDLDLRNEINHHYSAKTNNILEKDNYSGKSVESWFPIGVSLSWLPAFVVADNIANSLHSLNKSFPNNGYSNLYQITVGLFNIGFVTTGIVILYFFIKSFFSPLLSLVSIVTWLFASNLLFYSSIDVLNSHPLTFLLSMAFIYLWNKSFKSRTLKQWIYLGIILGILSIVRTQELLFGLFLIVDLIRMRNKWKVVIIPFLISVIIAIGIYTTQMILWNSMYHSFFISPYLKAGFSAKLPHIIDVLWSDKNGLLRWTPIFLFGFIGLMLMKKKDMWQYSLFFIITQFLMISSWVGMNYGGSYGMRLMLSSSFAFSFGLASFYEKVGQLLGFKWVIFFSILASVFNITNILYFLLFVQ